MEQTKEWKEITPNTWKPENNGDQITGTLIRKEPKTEELSARYIIQTTEGEKLVWGSTILDDKMQYIKPKDTIRITYKGRTKNKKGQDVKIFKLELRL